MTLMTRNASGTTKKIQPEGFAPARLRDAITGHRSYTGPTFTIVMLFLVSCSSGDHDRATPTVLAFPGAEGAGAFTPGGRGGKVYRVTTLADYVPGKEPFIRGSLREAIEAKGPRIVVFRVAGYIDLKTNLTVRNPYITIAGQTAPGVGVTLRYHQFAIGNTHDVIVRYLRSRVGDTTSKAGELDAITLGNAQNVIIDHCSATWATDEVLSVTRGSDKVTVQWSIIAEGLTKSSYGSLIGSYGGSISFHHNLYAHNRSRSPRPTAYQFEPGHTEDPGPAIDFRNNVIYNWGSVAGYTGSGNLDAIEQTHLNYVGNYLKPGPSTPSNTLGQTAILLHQGSVVRLYVAGNHIDGFPEGNRDNGRMIDGSKGLAIRLAAPISFTPVQTDDARTAYLKVLADVGATLPTRDVVDQRIVNSVRHRTGKVSFSLQQLGGWPVFEFTKAPADNDADGMADAWEQRYGLDYSDRADQNEDADRDGYTNIEEFLNGTNPIKST